MAIGICTLLVIIPAISAAIAHKPDLETDKLALARCLTTSRFSTLGCANASTQIELLEDELQTTHQKYLELEQKLH
ncbi:hypothetical protein [Nostoc sp.]|uniref:hypothetical protein n=1 Tax=Nostoc sp. TaxID=1180 RepID=UPI002FFA9E58